MKQAKVGGSIPVLISLCNLYKITLDDIFADYLTIDKKGFDISAISGYFNLSDEHQTIVNSMISMLSNLENKKN